MPLRLISRHNSTFVKKLSIMHVCLLSISPSTTFFTSFIPCSSSLCLDFSHIIPLLAIHDNTHPNILGVRIWKTPQLKTPFHMPLLACFGLHDNTCLYIKASSCPPRSPILSSKDTCNYRGTHPTTNTPFRFCWLCEEVQSMTTSLGCTKQRHVVMTRYLSYLIML